MAGPAGTTPRSGGRQVARTIARARDQGGLTAAELAKVMGIGTRQLQNWAVGKGTPANAERLRQLLNLQYVLDPLGDVYDAEGVMLWLHARNRALGGARPVDLMIDGGVDEVIQHLDQMADGN